MKRNGILRVHELHFVTSRARILCYIIWMINEIYTMLDITFDTFSFYTLSPILRYVTR